MTMLPENKPISKPPMSNVKLRVLTAFCFILLMYPVFQGGVLSALICFIFGAIMCYEGIHVSGMNIRHPKGILVFVMTMLPGFIFLMHISVNMTMPPFYVLVVSIVGLAIVAKDITSKLVLVLLCACIFAVVSFVMTEEGIKWLILVTICITVADSAAYFGGRAIGGPKLAPIMSPSKTWSGAICGITAGGVASVVTGMIVGFNPGISALVGFVIADLSIGGDLLASCFKRRHNVKDSGNILPGHGGFLDRFDGYLIVLPVLYLAVVNGLSGYGAMHGG